jgi:hypothetical protein
MPKQGIVSFSLGLYSKCYGSEWVRMWEKVVVAYFKVLYHLCPERTQEIMLPFSYLTENGTQDIQNT